MHDNTQAKTPQMELVDVMLENDFLSVERLAFEIINNIYDVLVYGQPIERRALVQRLPKIGDIQIYSDHSPPHFHIITPNLNLMLDLKTCEVVKGEGLSGKQKTALKDWYFNRGGQKLVSAYWNKWNPANLIGGA